MARAGNRLNRHAAIRIVRRLAKRAGTAKRIPPHSLRHSFITAALDAGVALRDVQIAARHADLRTTTRYDRARHDLDSHRHCLHCRCRLTGARLTAKAVPNGLVYPHRSRHLRMVAI